MHLLVLVVEFDLALQWNNTGKELHSKHTERLSVLYLPCNWQCKGKVYSN